MNLNRISETSNEKLEELIRNKKLDDIQENTIFTSNYILEKNKQLGMIKTILYSLIDTSSEIFDEYSDEKKRNLEIMQTNILNEFENFKDIIIKYSSNKEWDLTKLSSLIHKGKNVVNFIWLLNEKTCKQFAYAKDSLIWWISTFLLEFDFFDCNKFSFSDFIFDPNFSKLLFGENIKIFWNWDDVKISNFSYFVYLLWEIRQNYNKYGANWSLSIINNNDYLILNFVNEIKEVDLSNTYSTWNWTIIIKELVSNLNWKVNKFWINKTGLFEVNISFKI